MASLAQINIKFQADLKEFSTQMQNANRQIQKQGRAMQKIGKGLTLAISAPLLGVAVGAVKAAAELETLETSLSVMTGSAESGKRALKDLSDFTASTPFQLDQVGKAAKQLLAFGFSVDQVKTNLQTIGDIAAGSGNQIGDIAQIFGQVSAAGKLTGERFNQLQERAVPIGAAIAKTMGISESAVKDFITKGKIGFKEFETAFNSLAESGGLFSGAMDKQSKTLAGIFSTLKDNINLALGELGVNIAETFNLKGAATALIGKIQGIVESFKTLSPETKKLVLIMASIAAAIGPLLALAGTILPAIISGFAFLISPVGLVVAALAAVGVIIYKNWAPIKKTLVDIANYFIDLYNESTAFRIAVNGITLVFKNMFASVKFVFNAISTIFSTVIDDFIQGFKIVGKAIKGALTLDSALIKEAWEDYKKQGITSTENLIKNLKDDWKDLTQDVEKNITDAIENGGKKSKIIITPEQVDTTGVTEKIAGAAGAGTSKPTATALTGPSRQGLHLDSYTQKGQIEDLLKAEIARVQPLAQELRNALIINPNDTEAQAGLKKYEEQLTGFKSRLEGNLLGVSTTIDQTNESSKKLFMDIGPILGQAATAAISGFAEIGAAVLTGNASMGDLFGALIGLLGDVAVQIGKAAIAIGVGMLAVKMSFTNPLSAIAAGAALVLVGTLMKSLAANFSGGGESARPRRMASGGIVSGETLAMVGEYPGASSNPEVVAPLDKLKQYIQPANNNINEIKINGELRAEGRSLKLVLDRTNTNLFRTS